jgi:hypothetical protein
VRVLTSSSRHEKGRNGGKTVREDDVRVLTSSSRHEKGQNNDETVREDDVGVLTSSSRYKNKQDAAETVAEGSPPGARRSFHATQWRRPRVNTRTCAKKQ